MITLLSLLNKYIFSAIQGDATWDLITNVWQRITQKSWEELYFEAFRSAFEEEHHRFSKYANDGEVQLNENALNRALHRNLQASVDYMSLGEISEDQFINELAHVMQEQDVLEIGGHTLQDEDITQLSKNIVQKATIIFNNSIINNKEAFREAVFREAGENRTLVQNVHTYLVRHSEDTIRLLETIENRIGQQSKLLDQQSEQLAEIISYVRPEQQQDPYEEDKRRLIQRTRQTLALTSKYSRIQIDSDNISISRPCIGTHKRAVEFDSFLVVGEPGVGKSGALHELATNLIEDGFDVVFVTVDSLEANGLGGISNELRLSNDLVELLENWEGNKPAFFIIDALDAARSGQLARAIRDLITLIMNKATRWRVIASIRKFDLRYGEEIRNLFSGSPPTSFQDPEFTNVRHLNIPVLTDDEFQQVSEKSPQLGNLIAIASEELKNLLRVPFMLNIAGDLLTNGVEIDELKPVQSQIELLEKYWQKRVIRSDNEGDAREVVLQQITELMVMEQTLRVSRSRTINLASANSRVLTDLLSNQILTEWHPPESSQPERAILTFGHHFLYDYAIARLLLRGTAHDLVNHLSQQKHWTLTIRPSINLHFQYLWQQDDSRHRFWQVALALIASPDVPAIGKIIAPGIAAHLTASISDLGPLLTEITISESGMQAAAIYGLRHTIIIVGTDSADFQHPIVGEGAGPWATLAENLSESLSIETAYLIMQLLAILLKQPHLLTRSQLLACGIAARELLEFSWNLPLRNSQLVRRALENVCRTFSSEIDASAELIHKALEQKHLEKYGFEEMPELAEEILAIIPYDPRLVVEIYKTLFQYQETSREETHRGGQIFSITSTRAQDYEGALYRLAESFPHFLRISPDHAIQTLITVLENYVFSQPYFAKNRQLDRKSFEFRDREAVMVSDYSTTWDNELHRHDDPVKMLDSFSNYINEIAVEGNNVRLLEAIIDLVGQHNHLASLWKRLLICGTLYPQSVGVTIKSLAWTIPILIEGDTIDEAAKFIPAIYPFLSNTERIQVELAVLSISEFLHENRAELLRNFYLRSIPENLLESDKAKQTIADLLSTDPDLEKLNSRHDFSDWVSIEEAHDLRANASDEELHILDLTEQVQNFIQEIGNSRPTISHTHEIFAPLTTLANTLTNSDKINPDIVESALNSIIDASETISRADELQCTSEIGEFVREIMLLASRHNIPIFRSNQNEDFNKNISWGIPAPRVSAANGLVLIARYQDCLNEEVEEAINRLSTDAVPAVRFQVARNCNALYDSAPQLMWRLIEQFSVQEQNRGVLRGLLDRPFWQLLSTETDLIIEATDTIFSRIKEGNGADKVQALCARLFLRAYLLQEHTPSYELVIQIIERPVGYYDATQRILMNLRDPLSAYFATPQNPQRNQIRRRALALFTRLVRSLRYNIDQFNQQESQIFTDISLEEQGQVRNLAQLVSTVGTEVYFASGAFAEKEKKQGERILTITEKQQFLRDFAPIFDELVQIASVRLYGHGFGSMTHRIIEALEYLVPANPSQVFSLIGRFVDAGKDSGYQYESLAVSQVVNLVRLYLAQYRGVIQDEHQDTLIEILDIFVEVGWEEAIILANRLDEIFR